MLNVEGGASVAPFVPWARPSPQSSTRMKEKVKATVLLLACSLDFAGRR